LSYEGAAREGYLGAANGHLMLQGVGCPSVRGS